MSDAGSRRLPSPAGMYDYYLGGREDVDPVDAEAAERVLALVPEIEDAAWANRGFLQRSVRYMAKAGISQFLDLGAGLPRQRPTHEVAADFVDDPRVVYVDNDPWVMERGEDLLAGSGNAVLIGADIREPSSILDHPDTRRMLDLTRPVGVLLVSVLQFVTGEDRRSLTGRYTAPLASGSCLAVSVGTFDRHADRKIDRLSEVYDQSSVPGGPFTQEEFEMLFAGLEIIPPYDGAGPVVTYVGLWGAEDPKAADSDGSRWSYAAVGRKR